MTESLRGNFRSSINTDAAYVMYAPHHKTPIWTYFLARNDGGYTENMTEL